MNALKIPQFKKKMKKSVNVIQIIYGINIKVMTKYFLNVMSINALKVKIKLTIIQVNAYSNAMMTNIIMRVNVIKNAPCIQKKKIRYQKYA